MNRPHSIPVFVSLAFLLGCALGFEVTPSWQVLSFCGVLIFLIFILAYLRARRLFLQDAVFGITAFLAIAFLGVFNVQTHLPKNQPSHYIHHLPQEKAYLELTIKQQLRSNDFQDNFIAELKQIDFEPVQGKALLSIAKDSLFKIQNTLVPGSKINVYTHLNDIYKPLNPFQFDYGLFMENKKVLKQIQADPQHLAITAPEKENLNTKAALLRDGLTENLKKSKFSSQHIALMEALLLGQRTELARETYSQFTDAGVVHILAVSGLHVGIILYLLSILFKPITYLPQGPLIRMVIILILLWGYALVAGFSPSILRAVSMFSFLSLGLVFKRRVFSINMLCLSGLVLLLFNPYFLKDIGFQLSYSAVLSILIFYPKIYRLVPLHHAFVRYIWGIISVTLAAQIGVLPLSLFYFHQLPGLFFLSNLLLIPFLGIILGLGALTLLVLYFWGELPELWVLGYSEILDLLLKVISWVAQKERFIFRHVYFSETMLVFSLLSLLFLAFWLYKRKTKYLLISLCCVLTCQLFYTWEQREIHQIKTFYVFHKTRYSALGFQEQKQLHLQTNTEKDDLKFLEGLQDTYGISAIKWKDTLHNYYQIGSRQLLVIDEHKIYELPDTLKPTSILLRNSPQINLDRVLQQLQPKIVIADGSNYKNLIRKWKRSCENHGITFHSTSQQGAFQLNY